MPLEHLITLAGASFSLLTTSLRYASVTDLTKAATSDSPVTAQCQPEDLPRELDLDLALQPFGRLALLADGLELVTSG